VARGHAAGGSHGLAELIDLHGESLIADFERFYRPLPVIIREGASPRYILSLVKRLPPDSYFVAEIRGGMQFYGWTPDRYLAVMTVDAINANTYAVSKGNGGKGKKPEPIYRPQQEKPKTNMFAAMARAAYTGAPKKE